MEFEVQPKNLAAVEGYNATFCLASIYVFNSLSTLDTQCFLSSDKTALFLYEQLNPDCEDWLDNRTICYHDANSSSNANECCKSIVTLHSLPRVDEILLFTCLWRGKYFINYEFFNHPPNSYTNMYFSTSECK